MIPKPRLYDIRDILSFNTKVSSFRHLFVRTWTREEEDPGNEGGFWGGDGGDRISKDKRFQFTEDQCGIDLKRRLSTQFLYFGVIRKFIMNNVL